MYEESGSEAEEEEMEEMEEEEMEEGGEQDDDDDGEDDEDEGEMDEDEYPEEERELERNALLSKAAARNPAINNRPVLLEKLQDIVLGGGHKVPWVEVLTVSAPVTAESLVENVDDDLTRELAFYDMAIAGVKECHEKCRCLRACHAGRRRCPALFLQAPPRVALRRLPMLRGAYPCACFRGCCQRGCSLMHFQRFCAGPWESRTNARRTTTQRWSRRTTTCCA